MSQALIHHNQIAELRRSHTVEADEGAKLVPRLTTATPRRLDAATGALRSLTQDRRSAATMRAYAADLKDFFKFQGKHVSPASVAELCSLDQGELAGVLQAYQADMVARQLAEATTNRRLSAVRALLTQARRLGAGNPDPKGLVLSEKVKAYRDTRGVTPAEMHRVLEHAKDKDTLEGKRDYALLLLLAQNALRRAEVSGCNVADFVAASRRLHVRGKGRGTQKEAVTLSERMVAALCAYLDAREAQHGLRARTPESPLFCHVARRSDGCERLGGHGIWEITARYGQQVLGKALRPHQIRHTAITAALDASGGDMRAAQRLSRHKDIRTLQLYDDNREDLQGKMTHLLDALF